MVISTTVSMQKQNGRIVKCNDERDMLPYTLSAHEMVREPGFEAVCWRNVFWNGESGKERVKGTDWLSTAANSVWDAPRRI